MKDTNVIKLVDYIHTKNKIKTFDRNSFSKKQISDNENLGARGLAFILDSSLIFVIYNLVIVTYQNFLTTYFYHVPSYTKKALIEGTSSLSLSLSIVLFMTYFILAPYLFEGKTLGLKVMNLRVVNKKFYDGKDDYFTIDLKESLHRTCGLVLGILSAGLFFLVPFLTQHKKGIPDMLSNTFIISEDDFEAHLHNHSLNSEIITIDIETLAA